MCRGNRALVDRNTAFMCPDMEGCMALCVP